MAYNTYAYLFLFLGLTLILYYIFPKKYRWIVLLLVSYAFYWISSGKYIIFPLLTTVSVYYCATGLNKIDDKLEIEKKDAEKDRKKLLKKKAKSKKKVLVTFVALSNLFILLFLKYFNFFFSNVQLFSHKLGLSDGDIRTLKLVLPLGISFYTLQAVSYIVDVYRGTIKADKCFARVALFICFFPTIVEGPIARYDKLAYNAFEGHSFEMKNITRGAEIILWGMFKKVVIADRIDMFETTIFKNYADYSGLVVAVAVLLYTIQIYCEFSGCMDIVIGSARMLGITMPKNFNHPMFSKSVNEFWRRWHITLGEWIRDYVFYPISLSKSVQKLGKWSKKHIKGHLGMILPTIFALFFVWFCNGLWHGASWKYIFYGLYYYIIMTLGTLFEPVFKFVNSKLHINTNSKPYAAFQMLRTFILVNIGMLIFRAQGLKVGFQMFCSIFTGAWSGVLSSGALLKCKLDKYDFIVIIAGVLIVLAVSIIQEKGKSVSDLIAKQKLPVRWLIYLAGLFSVVIFGAYGPNYDAVAFIYAQF